MNTHRYQRPHEVAMVEGELGDDGWPAIYLAHLPNGPLAELDGPAAVIWQESLSDDEGALVERVAMRFGVPPEDILVDVEAFVADLLVRGLLEHRSPRSSGKPQRSTTEPRR